MNRIRLALCAGFMAVPGAVTADTQAQHPVTLYRSSAVDRTMRIHVATFDAAEVRPTYNSENCELAPQLFREQLGVNVLYWCEPGRYRRNE